MKSLCVLERFTRKVEKHRINIELERERDRDKKMCVCEREREREREREFKKCACVLSCCICRIRFIFETCSNPIILSMKLILSQINCSFFVTLYKFYNFIIYIR